jgi:hypothetical protein
MNFRVRGTRAVSLSNGAYARAEALGLRLSRSHLALAAWVVACLSCHAMPSQSSSLPSAPRSGTAQVSAESITEISLERRCFGCDREFKLTVKRDRTAMRTTFGNARQGTTDRQSTATMTAAAFDELAQRVVSEGFFQLSDEYRDPQVADGESAMTTVTAGGRQKTVLDRNGKAPAALQRIQARLEELAKSLVWKSNNYQAD